MELTALREEGHHHVKTPESCAGLDLCKGCCGNPRGWEDPTDPDSWESQGRVPKVVPDLLAAVEGNQLVNTYPGQGGSSPSVCARPHSPLLFSPSYRYPLITKVLSLLHIF